MQSLATHYHQMIGLNADGTVDNVELDNVELDNVELDNVELDNVELDNVELDMAAQTLSLALEFIGARVTCPDRSTLCARKDKAPERTWRHLDGMQVARLASIAGRCPVHRTLLGEMTIDSAIQFAN